MAIAQHPMYPSANLVSTRAIAIHLTAQQEGDPDEGIDLSRKSAPTSQAARSEGQAVQLWWRKRTITGNARIQ